MSHSFNLHVSPLLPHWLLFALLILMWPVVLTAGGPVPVARIHDEAQNDGPPNIVLFLVDDLGWQDSSVAMNGHPSLFQKHYRTPNVARLARTGVRFVNAYSHAVCSPTRTSILTGQNPARHHVTNWTLHADRDTSGTTERLAAPADWNRRGLQPAPTLLPERLREAGYRTIHVGKAHWGAIGTPGSDPRALGFDVNIAGHSAGAPGSYQGQDNYGQLDKDGKPSVWGVPGLEKYHGTETHLTDALATEAAAAIEAAVDSDQPFFLYMAPYAVHAPIQPHPRFIEHYRGKNFPNTEIAIAEAEARYASMVEGYDAALGQILNTLRERNIADRTLIIFTSDNGGLTVHARGNTPFGTAANTHNQPLREGKGSAYEGGTRVPMIVSWATPDNGSPLQKRVVIPRDVVCQTQVLCEDLMPTICRWAGATIANAETLDGRDWTPALEALAGTSPDREAERANTEPRPLLFHYPHVWGPRNGRGYQPHSAMRLGDWKVIYFYDIATWELYDVVNDIGEADDRATAEPERLRAMAERMMIELERCGAQYPVNRATGEPMTPVLPGE